MSLSALIGGAKCPLAQEIEACMSRLSGQNALRTLPWSFLLITRYCFTLYKEWISPNSFLCIYNKNCHQANGDNRHLVPDVPIGLGRDIRDIPIACARTHPDADKHTRHIPMYRPVHSAHANKCSHTGTTLPLVLAVRQRCSRCRNDPCHTSRTAEYPQSCSGDLIHHNELLWWPFALPTPYFDWCPTEARC